MEDTFKHKGLRSKLVEEVRKKGIKDEKILAAINKVPRHAYLDSSFDHLAYKDKALPIQSGQTISQPYTVAFQTELLQVEKLHKVLEIGTGSGYQTAVLLELGAKVFSIERQKELFLLAQERLPKMGYNPFLYYGDGYKGLPTYGPFDRILVTAGAPNIPEELVKQLKVGGRMVIPVGDANNQVMKLIEKKTDDNIEVTDNGYFIFVPLVKGRVT